MLNKSLWVIIPVFNRIEYTRKCLKSLEKQTFTNFKTIIFNDGSTDGTDEMLKSEFPNVIQLKGDGNYWWTRSVNESIKYSIKNGATHIFTLNNDLEIDENALDYLINLDCQYPNSIIGCTGFDLITGELVQTAVKHNWLIAKTKNTEIKDEQILESDFLPGRGLIIPVDVFKKIGFFDEKNFPQSYADWDFTFRAKKNGYKLLIAYKAKIFFYSDETALMKYKFKKNFANFIRYLFSIRSSACIPVRIKFIVRNCPLKCLPTYFFFDMTRVILSYLKS